MISLHMTGDTIHFGETWERDERGMPTGYILTLGEFDYDAGTRIIDHRRRVNPGTRIFSADDGSLLYERPGPQTS